MWLTLIHPHGRIVADGNILSLLFEVEIRCARIVPNLRPTEPQHIFRLPFWEGKRERDTFLICSGPKGTLFRRSDRFFGYYHLQEKTRAQSLFCRAEKIYIFMVLWLWKCYCFAFVTICYNLYYYVTRVVTLNVTRSNRLNVTWTGEGDVKTKMQNLINDYERKWPSSDIRKPVLTQI